MVASLCHRVRRPALHPLLRRVSVAGVRRLLHDRLVGFVGAGQASLADAGRFCRCLPEHPLLYLPWLPAMLNRYAVDRSYWQGALKINEALRHVAISFTTGAPETMLERDAVRLLPWFGVALIVAAALVWPAGAAETKESGPARGSSSAGVVAFPVVAVLLLASRTPKFNPRYLMLVSPAYLLIMAGGIGTFAGGASELGAEEQGKRVSQGIRGTQYAIRSWD